jgi:hypothetical protein
MIYFHDIDWFDARATLSIGPILSVGIFRGVPIYLQGFDPAA